MSSIFKATVRHSGNSLVITIPKGVHEGLEIQDGDEVNVTVRLMGESKEDQE